MDDIPLRIRRDSAGRCDLTRVTRALIDRGLIEPFGAGRYPGLYVRPASTLSTDQVVCFMDPLAYLSHLSAMEWHGITDRRQKGLQITSPRGTRWTQLINTLMAEHLMSSEWLGPGEAQELQSEEYGPFASRHFAMPGSITFCRALRGEQVEDGQFCGGRDGTHLNDRSHVS